MDVRLAELLGSYNVSGTFYVPIRYGDLPRMSEKELRLLYNMGMEIGSHTLTHPELTGIENHRVIEEFARSKEILEDALGEQVLSLGYPKGKYNRTVCSLAKEAGYRLARTTVAFRTEPEFDPFAMPVSFQFFPHTPSVHIRHALKEGNLKGVINWCRLWNMENDLFKLSESVFDHVLKHGGVFHIWGHSWEIEKFNLWEPLEKVIKYISNREEVLYLTNAQVLNHVS